MDEAFAKLVGVADTSDTHRLRALAYLMKGDLPSASKEIEKATDGCADLDHHPLHGRRGGLLLVLVP